MSGKILNKDKTIVHGVGFRRKKYDKDLQPILDYIKNLRVLGLTWEDVENQLRLRFILTHSFDHYRKIYHSLDSNPNIDAPLDTLTGAKIMAKMRNKILVDRKINVIQRRDLNKQARAIGNFEILNETLKNYVFKYYETPKIVYKQSCKNKFKNVIYILGDFHFRGKQDEKLICDLFNKIIYDIKEHNYQNIDLWLLGDYIDGEIHQEQIRENDTLINSTIAISNLLVYWINRIKQVRNVKMVYGNHDEIRLWGEKGTKNNVGKFIASFLKVGLRKDIKLEFGEELTFIYNKKLIFLAHGHQVFLRSKNKMIESLSTKFNILPDVVCIGHYHSSKTNQFARGNWFITSPAIKNWESDWDKTMGFCGLGQFIKLKLNLNSPQITTIDIKKGGE